MKKEFIKNEIWSLTIAGAFQRANIYKKDTDEKDKKDFKEKLNGLIIEIVKQYEKEVDEQTHLKNIIKITEFRHDCLVNEKLKYGVCQKILNLYLKYLWCLEQIPVPPHFPVDRIIQEELNKGRLVKNEIVSWTKMEKEEQYLKLIRFAETLARKEKISIAELELIRFSRRNKN
jgi:hypothetical protein